MPPVQDDISAPCSLLLQDMLEGYAVVFDAVYTPPSTRLLKEAKAAGATPVSGVEMFVRQGADQFFNFTGRMRKGGGDWGLGAGLGRIAGRVWVLDV